jgi:hypothetical protein
MMKPCRLVNELAALSMGGAVLMFVVQQPGPAGAAPNPAPPAKQRAGKPAPKLSARTMSLQLASLD